MPGENLISLCSLMIRSSKKVDQLLKGILMSETKVQFYKQMDRMEEELDDIDNWEQGIDTDFCEGIGSNFNYDTIQEENIEDIPTIDIEL